MNVAGKRVVLTGATGGIGRAMAQQLAAAGAQLVLVARDEARLERQCAGLSGTGHRAVAADIADPQGRRAVVAACASGVAGLVNNAGVNHFALLQDQSDDGVRQMFEVNVIAPILLVRDLLPALKLEDGFIVNVGSGFGAVGFPGYSAYSASKFALRGFTEALRRELADTRVGVLYLAPRATDTGMNPPEVVALNRDLGNTTDPPERVADELLALIRKGKGCRAIGWRERFFARLNGLFPSLVDAALKKQLPGIRRSALAAAERGA